MAEQEYKEKQKELWDFYFETLLNSLTAMLNEYVKNMDNEINEFMD